MKGDIIVLSIKPKYARAIYEGRKNWEFRKVPPPLFRVVFLYESVPVQAITGTCVFVASVSGLPETVYDTIKRVPSEAVNKPGITLAELKEYAGGKPVTALRAIQVMKMEVPVPLRARPPQNWCRITSLRPEGSK